MATGGIKTVKAVIVVDALHVPELEFLSQRMAIVKAFVASLLSREVVTNLYMHVFPDLQL